MADVLVIASKVKEYIKNNSEDFRCSGDVAEHLTELIKQQLDAAIRTCSDSGQQTVKAKHFAVLIVVLEDK